MIRSWVHRRCSELNEQGQGSAHSHGITFTRVALTPFDSRLALSDLHHVVCAGMGWKELTEWPWIEHLVSEKLAIYEVAADHLVLLCSQGFGLNLRRVTASVQSLEDHRNVAELLVGRANHHQQVRNGSHSDMVSISRLKRSVSARCSRDRRKELRPDIWVTPPYTLSFFYIPAAASAQLHTEKGMQGLSALVEPSQIMRSELTDAVDDRTYCAKMIATLNVERLQKEYHDSDIKAGSTTFCSWAGMVAFDGQGTDLPYLESLEIRLQCAWLRANFVRQWAEQQLSESSLEPEELTKVAAEITPLVRQSRRLINATASTREQELFDELVETSDLEREIVGAEEAIEDVRKQIDIARSVVRRRYNKTVEALLFLLAMLQLVPFVFEVPFVKLSPWWVAPFVAIVLLFVVIRAHKT